MLSLRSTKSERDVALHIDCSSLVSRLAVLAGVLILNCKSKSGLDARGPGRCHGANTNARYPPCSGLVSWLVVLAGVLMSMHVVGVNIQPLLTVGGVSGVIVGLSAQSVMANMISGINLVRHACMQVSRGCLSWCHLSADLVAVGDCQCMLSTDWPSCHCVHQIFCYTLPIGNCPLTKLHFSISESALFILQQFLSQSFVVGDRVEILTSSGSRVINDLPSSSLILRWSSCNSS